jgi:membrane protease YdiL (CAAX protease family)
MTKRAINFIVLTFGLSWILAIVFKLLGGRWNTELALIIAVIYMFCPLISVLILEKFFYHNQVKETCGINFGINIWFVIGWILPLFVSFASIPVAKLFPNVEISYSMETFFDRLKDTLSSQQLEQLKQQIESSPIGFITFGVIQSLFAGATINAVAAFGEEIGWRGFLYNELNKKFNFWQTAVITGFIWGLWHMALILQGHNYPKYPVLGSIWMIIFCILYSPIFNFIRKKSGSVIATSILHGTLNTTFGFSILFLKGGNELIVGVLGISGFVVLAIINIILFLLPKEILEK